MSVGEFKKKKQMFLQKKYVEWCEYKNGSVNA